MMVSTTRKLKTLAQRATLLGLLVSGCSREEPAPEQAQASPAAALPPVQLGEVRAAVEVPLQSTLASLTLISGAEQELGPPLSGRLQRWLVAPGQRVEPGTPLAELVVEELIELRAEEAAQQQLVKTRSALLEGVTQQVASGLVSQQAVREARAQLEEAQARLTALRSQLRQRQRHGALGQAPGAIQIWESSVTGTLTERRCAPGQRLTEETRCVVIVDHASQELRARFPQEQLAILTSGVRGHWHSAAGGMHRVTLDRVAPVIDAPHRMLTTFWRVELTDVAASDRFAAGLIPGMSGRLELLAAPTSDVLLVDPLAISRMAQRDVVFAPSPTRNGEFVAIPITVLAERAEGTLVRASALQVGDMVVTRGAFALKAHLLLNAEQSEDVGGAP